MDEKKRDDEIKATAARIFGLWMYWIEYRLGLVVVDTPEFREIVTRTEREVEELAAHITQLGGHFAWGEKAGLKGPVVYLPSREPVSYDTGWRLFQLLRQAG